MRSAERRFASADMDAAMGIMNLLESLRIEREAAAAAAGGGAPATAMDATAMDASASEEDSE